MANRPLILPPALGLLTMLGVFAAHFIQPITLLFPYPTNYIALIPIAVGATLNILADRELRAKKAIEVTDPSDAPTRLLVSSGVYRLSRNPSYLGLVFIVSGLAIWVGSLSPWLAVAGFVWFLSYSLIRKEEAALAQQFGTEYQQYIQTTPRWFVFYSKLK